MMKITIRQFQALDMISNSNLDDFDKSIEIVKLFTGMSQKRIELMNAKKFNRICSVIFKQINSWNEGVLKGKPKKIISVRGKLYKLEYDILKMTAGKYVEGVTFLKDQTANLHKVLASMATPLRWTWRGLKEIPVKAEDHQRLSEIMLDAEYEDIYHALVFFYAVFKGLQKNLDTSGSPEVESRVAQLLMRLTDYGDGFTKPAWYQNMKELA